MSSVFPPGVQLATRYRVLRVLESKPVSALYEAERLDTQRRVALKWLRFGAGHAQLAQQRAARARAAIMLRHPQLAVMHDVAHEGTSVFVVSELLQGEPLRARLAPHSMPLHERLRALADVGCALAFAHQKGAVHGGIHPGNVYLHHVHSAWMMLPPVVKVHDFGTATNTMPECLAYPAERSALGAHAFLDHAQLCGAEPDVQSDIYAYAVLLFQALTGCVPFAAKSPIELAVTLATSPVPTVGGRHPGLPTSLDALIHQSLQHQRDERPKQLEPLVAQVSAYAEALAARELLDAPDRGYTRPLIRKRAFPGAQVTRVLTMMGGDTARRSVAEISPAAKPAPAPTPAGLHAATADSAQLGATSVAPPLAVPTQQAEPEASPAAHPTDEPGSRRRADATPIGRQPNAFTYEVACLTLEVLPSGDEDEFLGDPTAIDETPTFAEIQRAGHVGVADASRSGGPRQLVPAPPESDAGSLLRTLQSRRGRAWSAGAAAILALAGISTSLVIGADPENLSQSAPPTIRKVYHAQPAPHRRRRDPMLVEAPVTSTRGASVDAPARSARGPNIDAPADPTRDDKVDEKSEQPEHSDSQVEAPLDEAVGPARRHGIEPVSSFRARRRSERSENRQVEIRPVSNDGYRVGTPPTEDQF